MGFNQAAAELRRLMDEGAWQASLATLSPDTRTLIDHPPTASEWLDVRHFLAMMDAPRKAALSNWQALAYDSGYAATRRTFKTVHRVFIQMLDPAWVIRRTGNAWGSYYKDFGGPPDVVESSAKHVLLRFHGTGAHAAFWHHIRGGLGAICELTRLKEPKQTLVDGGVDGCDEMLVRIDWVK